MSADALLIMRRACEKDCGSHRLRAPDAIRMIMRNLRAPARQLFRLCERPRTPADRGHPHGGAVAVAVIGGAVSLIQPAASGRKQLELLALDWIELIR